MLLLTYNCRAGNINRPEYDKLVDFVNCNLTDSYISVIEAEKSNYEKIRLNLKKIQLRIPLAIVSLLICLRKIILTIHGEPFQM